MVVVLVEDKMINRYKSISFGRHCVQDSAQFSFPLVALKDWEISLVISCIILVWCFKFHEVFP